MDDEPLPPDAIRSAREVAARALALFAVVGTALGAPRGEVVPWLQSEGLWTELSPRERAFLEHANAPERARIEFSWHSERLLMLLWALGRIRELPTSATQCDTRVFQDLLPPFSEEAVADVLGSARLLSDKVLIDKADQLLQEHWRARDARSNGKPMPADIDIEIVQERHQAINWITGYDGLPWDEVTTDT